MSAIRNHSGSQCLSSVVGDRPDFLTLSEQREFRRFWYGVAFSSAIGTEPVAREVLGTNLVLWRASPTSGVSAALDRCAHRDAPLSRGWVDRCHLVCPYHGWEWDSQGRTQRIPQFPEAPHPTKSALTMVAATEQYGLVWVCLAGESDGGPICDIPPVTEYGDPAWRMVPEREWRFDCTAMHLAENNFDSSHVAFVHANSFGNRNKPELYPTTVTRTPYGLRICGQTPVEARAGEAGPTVRHTEARLYFPFFGHITITYPDGLVHVMVKAITPIDDGRTQIIQTVFRNDTERERPAAEILAFDDIVENEDRELLELLPKEYPLAQHLNAHAKADRDSLALRRLWSDFIIGRFTPEPNGHE